RLRVTDMLARHIIGYVPSFVIPALMAFAAIFCYTHLLSPEEYGAYALTTNSMVLLVAIFYNWLQASMPRLLPQAVREGRYEQFQVPARIIFLLTSTLLAILVTLGVVFAPHTSLKAVAWPALGLTLARGLLNLNQSFHRSHLNFRRYNLIECGQAVLGL